MTNVIIEKCVSYDQVYLKKSLEKIVDSYDSIKKLKPNSKILLKANLVIRKRPELAATTNPKLLRILADILINRGFIVIIGDSPGGVYNKIFLKSVYRVCGLTEELRTSKAEFNYNTEIEELDNSEGLILKKITITKYINDIDFIINVPKLKSHAMMVYTGAVKNMFGIIPGEKKAECHFNAPNYNDFSNLLIDVFLHRKPNLNIMDAIIGMEGQGPTSGNPINIGLILSSEDGFALDFVALNIVNINPEIVPIMKMAFNRGLVKNDINSINIIGEKIEDVNISNFEYIEENNLKNVIFTDNIIIKKMLSKLRSKPIINYEKCIKCKECYKVCPAKVITFDDNCPEIKHNKCIKCFCCHELCPVSAIDIKKSKIMLIIIKMGAIIKSINIKLKDMKNNKKEKEI
ncbi:MAG: DUF362 domain-containing protein [Clostridiales bacterium]